MYYNARWYDPSLGRFAQADTIVPPGVQGLDRYAYVNNSPMNYVDPSGHICINNQGSDNEVAMPGGCNGAPNPNWNGQVTPSPSGWAGHEEDEPIITANNKNICGSSTTSVICRDPSIVGEGTVFSDPEFPTRMPSKEWEPAGAELTPIPLVSGFLLLADFWGYYQYSDGPFNLSLE